MRRKEPQCWQCDKLPCECVVVIDDDPKPAPPEVPAEELKRIRAMQNDPRVQQTEVPAPIPCTMYCPFCGTLHVDEGEWATRPHHKHLCQNPKCGKLWRVEPYCYGVDPGPKDDMQNDFSHAHVRAREGGR